jgi:hypothetical protein
MKLKWPLKWYPIAVYYAARRVVRRRRLDRRAADDVRDRELWAVLDREQERADAEAMNRVIAALARSGYRCTRRPE